MVDETAARSRVEHALIAAAFAALWPVWAWYARRLWASPDEAAGLVAAALACALARRRVADRAGSTDGVPAFLFALHAAAFPFAPPLLRAASGVTALAALLSGRRFGRTLDPGFWLLLLLSLPVMPSLQFYCGYPLRRAAALAAALALRAQGVPVRADGAALDWAGRQLSVDAPCSGLKMLWVALVLSAALSCHARWGWRATAGVTLSATLVALLANAWRATALFHVETNPSFPGWIHEGVGLFCFAAAAAVIVAGAHGAQRWAAAR